MAAFNFPNTPTNGQIYSPGAGLPSYQWVASIPAWMPVGSGGSVADFFAYTATGGETSVTVTGGYLANLALVSRNGAMQAPADDVDVTSGTVVGFATPLVAGESILVIKFRAFSLLDVLTKSQNLADLPNIPAARANLGVAVELIETASVGTANTKEFLLPAGFKSFHMRLRGVAGTAQAALAMNFSLDGTTWKAANGDYVYSHEYNYVSGGVGQYGSDDGLNYAYALGGWVVGANTAASIHTIDIVPGDGTDFTTILSRQSVFSTALGSSHGGGYMAYTGRPQKGRLFFSAGNLAKGSYDLYGHR